MALTHCRSRTAKNEKKDYSFCGGGYLKLLGAGMKQAEFGGSTVSGVKSSL